MKKTENVIKTEFKSTHVNTGCVADQEVCLLGELEAILVIHVSVFLITRGILEMKLQNTMCERKCLYESQSVQLREKNRYRMMSNRAALPHVKEIHNKKNKTYGYPVACACKETKDIRICLPLVFSL